MIVIFVRSRVVVHESRMRAWTATPRGAVARVIREVVRDAKKVAATIAPRGGTGELARSYETSGVFFGPKKTTYRLRNKAPYARWVMKGTHRIKSPTLMPVGKSAFPGSPARLTKAQIKGGRVTFRRTVRGQRAQGEEKMVAPVRVALARRGIV